MKLHGLAGPHYCWNFIEVLILYFFSFGALQKLPGAVQDVPQDVSEHYCKFKSFLFFPITNMSWGRRWLWSPPAAIYVP